jgi:hypothetical protein
MKIILSVIVFTMFVTFAFSEEIVLHPVDDMYTDPNGASENITELWTANFPPGSNFQRIMIKFDLESFYDVEVESATLNLTRFYSCPSGGTTSVTIHAINEHWDEETWNFNNHVNYHQDNSIPFVFSGTGGNIVTGFGVDITSIIQLWLDQTISNNGLVIIANSNQKFSKFYSKEFSNVEYRPFLTLQLENVSADTPLIEQQITIARNYPNPFNPVTTIEYHLPAASSVEIILFNSKGQLIKEFSGDYQTEGKHLLVWDGKDFSGKVVSSGVYMYRITTEYDSVIKPMVMIK